MSFSALIELCRAFKEFKMSVNELKSDYKMFVCCHRLLIWKTQTCSWRNVATDDVLPRFSRQPMEKKEWEFLLSPLLLRSSARTDQLRGCKLKCFSPLDSCIHHILSYRTKSHLISTFSAVFCFSFISFYSKTRQEELQGCYKPKLCDPATSLLRSCFAIGWLWGSWRLWLAQLAVRLA